MQAITITSLSDPVSIVHIPVNRSGDYATKLYWTIDKAATNSAEFFNVTSNQVEIAIFGSAASIEAEWTCDDPDVRVSSSWRVFEISSGDEGDTGNYDSPHLRYVSGPLARAGISILYQSSYFCDYLLCKSEDFDKVATIFVSQGWQVNDADPIPNRRRSGLYTPHSSTSGRSGSPRVSASPPPSPIPTSPEITVLSAPLACVGFAKSAERACNERLRKYITWPERSLFEWEQPRLDLIGEDRAVDQSRGRPFVSYTRTEDGTSLVTEVKALRGMFPAGDMEELDVQCAGELSCDDENEDDDDDCDSESESESGDEKGQAEVEYPILSPSIDKDLNKDITMSSYLPNTDVPPTPPLTASSTTSSPGKKRLSLPLSPQSEIEIPFSWSRRTTRSMSLKINQSMAIDGENQKKKTRMHGERIGNGTKRCLQLDLRGVSSSAEEAYHLDKFGLVTLFSDLLDSAQIKMLYSSTFHTANILVEPEDVSRARRLLKRGSM